MQTVSELQSTCALLNDGTDRSSVEKFCNFLRKEVSLQEILKTAPNVNSFVTLLINLSKENGYHLTAEEVYAAIASVPLSDSNEELAVVEPDEKMLLNVAGGESVLNLIAQGITDNQDTLTACNCRTSRFTDWNCGPCR